MPRLSKLSHRSRIVFTVIATVCAALLALSGTAAAGYGGGYGGTGGNGIWALAWWAGNPQGPGPYTGSQQYAVDLCAWHDTGTTVRALVSALGESSLPGSFWHPGTRNGGIWFVLSWAAGLVQSGARTDHFDLVACPQRSEVPPNAGGDGLDLPTARPPGGRQMHLWIFWDTVPDPSGGALPAVIDRAFREVHLPAPDISISPSRVGAVSDATVVNVSTWMWIDRSIWRTFSATATAGPYVATVWARPVRVTWSAGWDFTNPASDPEHGTTLGPEALSQACNGPGVAWPAAGGPDGPACTAQFAQSTLGTRQPLRATVSFVVNWALSNTAGVVGGEGLLPDSTTSATLPLRVMQIESIIANG